MSNHHQGPVSMKPIKVDNVWEERRASFRVLVCGGRSYDEWRMLSAALAGLCPTVVIQGGANGADALARRWAQCNGIPVVTYEANWKAGKKAGPMRNEFMLKDSRPDLVVAFPGGRGTADMIARAQTAGVEVWHPLPSPPRSCAVFPPKN